MMAETLATSRQRNPHATSSSRVARRPFEISGRWRRVLLPFKVKGGDADKPKECIAAIYSSRVHEVGFSYRRLARSKAHGNNVGTPEVSDKGCFGDAWTCQLKTTLDVYSHVLQEDFAEPLADSAGKLLRDVA